jgi:hypothetical protein
MARDIGIFEAAQKLCPGVPINIIVTDIYSGVQI